MIRKITIPFLLISLSFILIAASPNTHKGRIVERVYLSSVISDIHLKNDGEGPEVIPVFQVISVVPDQTVTILTENFPANDSFVVTMGEIGTKGVGGINVATVSTGAGGGFQRFPAGERRHHNAPCHRAAPVGKGRVSRPSRPVDCRRGLRTRPRRGR